MREPDFNLKEDWSAKSENDFVAQFLHQLTKDVSEKVATKYLKKKYRELTRVKSKNTKNKPRKSVRSNSRGKRE